MDRKCAGERAFFGRPIVRPGTRKKGDRTVSDANATIAEAIKKQLGANPDVGQVTVHGTLLKLHIAPNLYQRLASDRDRGRKIVLLLMQQMKQLTGEQDVTVWVYCNREKLIEGKVMNWGGDNVNYLCDL